MSILESHRAGHRPADSASGDLSPCSDADIGACVARRFDRAVAEPSERAMDALREATIALATAVRATALRPERAVIMLKEVLRGHGGAGWAPSISAPRDAVPGSAESQVYGQMFSWWVAAYYSERSPELPQRRAGSPPADA